MPVFKINNEFVYFAHVPKCGGKSVESYIRRRFGDIAFLEPLYLQRPPHARWSCTSPQHLDWESFTRLFPENWITASFGIVRHPLARVKSAFDYQFSVAKTLNENDNITDWFASYVQNFDTEIYKYDHHLRPQSDLLPPGAQIFHLELGLDGIVSYLDECAGDSSGPRTIFHENKRRSGNAPSEQASAVTPQLKEAVSAFYEKDFQTFGYHIDRKKPDATAPYKAPVQDTGVFSRRTLEALSLNLKKIGKKVLKS
tara:strand:- start:15269 stop:16033 length:765 start_codon:yes stop_codon:yes gene_type:complete